MHKALKKRIAAALSALLLTLPAQALALDPVMPLASLGGGEVGTAYTVLDGSGTIESFRVGIVGPLAGGKGTSPKLMARASGSAVERAGGILQGMSGSPVYIDGCLVGAVASGMKDLDPYTFFITPIEEMLPLWNMPDKKNKNRLSRTVDLKKYAETRAKEAEAKAKEEAEAKAAKAGEQQTGEAAKAEGAAKDAPAKGEGAAKEEPTTDKAPAEAPKPAKTAEEQTKEPAAEAAESAEKTAAGMARAPGEEPKDMLFVSGFNQAGLGFLERGLGKSFQLMPMGLEAGTGMLATDYNAELYPGSAVGVAVVYGDFLVGATGTVTAVDGKRILAFGHPFMHRGNVNYFMTDASVVGTYSGVSNGMKIANIGNIIGRINQDREAGIAGILGTFPAVVPMNVHVEDKELARSEDYGVRIAYDEDYLAQLVGGVAYAALSKTSDTQSAATASLAFTIRTDAVPEGEVTRKNMFYNTSDVGQIAVGELMQAMDYICLNKDRESDIVDVKVDISLENERKTATLISATPDKAKVLPGETVTFKTIIKPYRGEKETLEIPYTVPDMQPEGRMNLDVRGGGFVPVSAAALLQQAGLVTAGNPEEKEQTTADRLKAMVEAGRNNEIIITPGAAQQPLSEREQRKLLEAAKERAQAEARNHKVEFLKDEGKKPGETKFETPYIIDNVIHATLQIEKSK